MNLTHESTVNRLAAEFGSLDTIPASMADKLIDLLESAPDEALVLIVNRRIKFCHFIARRILKGRGVKV